MTQRVFRRRDQTPAQDAHKAAVRKHFQRARPSLRQRLESGDGTDPMMQRECFELQVACRERLRPLREAAGLSLSDMATRTGMDRSAIQKLESGVHANPTISTFAGRLPRQ